MSSTRRASPKSYCWFYCVWHPPQAAARTSDGGCSNPFRQRGTQNDANSASTHAGHKKVATRGPHQRIPHACLFSWEAQNPKPAQAYGRAPGWSVQSKPPLNGRSRHGAICIEEHIDVSLPPLKLQVLGEEISDIATLVDLVQRDDLVRPPVVNLCKSGTSRGCSTCSASVSRALDVAERKSRGLDISCCMPPSHSSTPSG